MILLIDNFDSFTHNLYQLIASLSPHVEVVRNNAITIEQVRELNPQAIILSPGPGAPSQAGICIELIKTFAPHLPILGVCLGHQAIGEAFGAAVVRAPEVLHGKSSAIFHKRSGLFKGLPLPFTAGRYHSLVVDDQTLPKELLVEAKTAEGIIMGLKHYLYPCYGVQFHPESILTPEGKKIVENFICHELKHVS